MLVKLSLGKRSKSWSILAFALDLLLGGKVTLCARRVPVDERLGYVSVVPPVPKYN